METETDSVLYTFRKNVGLDTRGAAGGVGDARPVFIIKLKSDILKNKRLRIFFKASPYTDKDSWKLKFPVSQKGMSAMDEKQKKEYQEYVKQVTPTHNLWLQMLKAFVVGGIICVIGQAILNTCAGMGLDKDASGGWSALLLILMSVVLTGFNIYPSIVKWGGAGALVPITGFANSVAAPAIEFKSEGQVFGVGCKIFTIAGPVILYGIFTSWVLGVIYWILKLMGVM